MKYNDKKINVIKVSYFDNENIYVEVFLNQNFESLVWRRYTKKSLKNEYTNEVIVLNNQLYDLDYYCITSRL